MKIKEKGTTRKDKLLKTTKNKFQMKINERPPPAAGLLLNLDCGAPPWAPVQPLERQTHINTQLCDP